MVGSCANPECEAEFRYFRRGGRVVVVELAADSEHPGRRRDLLWLCENCARAYDIVVVEGEPKCVPKPEGGAKD